MKLRPRSGSRVEKSQRLCNLQTGHARLTRNQALRRIVVAIEGVSQHAASGGSRGRVDLLALGANPGSGCQLALLHDADLKARLARAGVGLLLIHDIDPYGFSHLQRTNEDNFDVNRNFEAAAARLTGARCSRLRFKKWETFA